MEQQYREFLAGKETSWKKAKQREYSSIEKLVLSLKNYKELTTRSAMTLRILGLLTNMSNDVLEVTPAGEALLSAANPQEVLDEQLLKIYLDSYVNTRLKISVYPMVILYKLLRDLEWITFEEYKLFACWISDNTEITKVTKFITNYRESSQENKNNYHAVFDAKVRSLQINDFDDNIQRLYAVFTLSSFISIDEEEEQKYKTLYRNSELAVYDKLIAAAAKIVGLDYENEVHGYYLGLIDTKAQRLSLTTQIQSLSKDEADLLERQIKERKALPDLSEVRPVRINPSVVQKLPVTARATGVRTPKKTDYVARDTRNRLVGRFGEKIALIYEYDKLVAAGKYDLAEAIEHCSETDDTLGYDIESFHEGGTPKHIEVKSVKGQPRNFSFFISKNELEKVENDPAHCIYIVFAYETTEPKVWEFPHLKKCIDEKLVIIEPTNYQVFVAIEN